MSILLIVSLLIPVIGVGYLMIKLDKFLEKGGFVTEDDKICPFAIVLGETDLAKQMTELLEKNGISVLVLAEPFLLEKEKSFQYIFALSESDVDNIVLCKAGKKLFNIEKMISLCNDQRNENIFRSEKIRYLLGEHITAQILYQIILQESEVHGE
ncbi:hypothetical protein [Cellulosilyticum sp. I15G10I2]|uniref:hypothetical protein n=1 Tax=Cellulosilyticum sp. I15G10I2 TaxID=1892843 RepID=UPI00085BD1EF|nr:hypothetical protein [Cellulosilyticum sp. I15G10I2]